MSELIIRIGAESKKFDDELEKIQKKTEALEDQLSGVAKVSGVAFAALTAEAFLSVKAFEESDAIARKLTQALQNQGVFSRALVDDYKAQAEAVQALTGVDDDLIIAGQTVLQNFLGQQHITPELTQAMVDLAETTGSVESASELLGRAYAGNVKGLKQYGIEIKENLSQQQRLDAVLQQVNQKFGGQAAAANQGVGGIRGLQTALGNLQEEIGSRLAPIVAEGIRLTTNFLNGLRENQGLVDLGVRLGAAALAASALGVGLGVLGLAIVKTTALVAALGVAFNVSLGPIGLVSAALIAGAGALGYFASSSLQAEKGLPQLRQQLRDLNAQLYELEKVQSKVARSKYVYRSNDAQIDETNAKIAETIRLIKEAKAAQGAGGSDAQDEKQAKAAAEARAREAEQEAERLRAIDRQNEMIQLKFSDASKQMIELKTQQAELEAALDDEKYAASRGALEAALAENSLRQLQVDEQDRERRKAYSEQVLAENEEYQALTEEQKILFQARIQELDQNAVLTETDARLRLAQERDQLQRTEQERFLKRQIQFGTALAEIDRFTNTERFKAAQGAAQDMAQLQTSSNATLKSIGKAFAVSDIAIRTATTAIRVYEGFSTIPIIGPALGVAAAAAAIAFGAEQTQRVLAANQGGIVTGGRPGVDSVPAMLTPGELVVPEQNFEEVVSSVAGARGGEGGGGAATIVIELKDGLMDFIEARLVERRALNLSIQGS